MKKKIDINNEKQILKECNFEYFYNSKECSSELCRFYNDILNNLINRHFDSKQALIDLGKIAITLNEQHEKINELELLLNGKDKMKTMSIKGVEKLKQENQQLKQSQNSKSIEVLEKLRNFYNSDSDNDWIIDCCKLDKYVGSQIAKLRGEKQ